MSLKYILLIPFVEILLFVLFGDYFGFFPVISSIIITFFIGIYFLKLEINKENVTEITSNPKNWIYKKIAGILLIIPGFLTDFVGILLLFNSLRFLVWGFIPEKTKNHFYDNEKAKKDEIIEVDYRDLDDR